MHRPVHVKVSWNYADAAVAVLLPSIEPIQGYLPSHDLPQLTGTARAELGDRVFKVGRTSGLTYGEGVETSVVVGPVRDSAGDVWFRDSFVVEGTANSQFSRPGDAGAVIVKMTGEVIGLLYGASGMRAFASPIEKVLELLECSLL